MTALVSVVALALVAVGLVLVVTGQPPRPASAGPPTAVGSATVAAFETTTSAVFVDLATPGPTVTVQVGPSGRALVIISAGMSVPDKGGAMGFEVTGASHLPAALSRSLALGSSDPDPHASVGAFFSRVVQVDGLTPGVNVFTAKYVQTSGTSAVGWQDRTITVLVI